MKFEHALEFNSVPEWRGHYLNYEQLKRLVYAVEAQQSAAQRASLDLSRRPSGVQEDPEAGSPLLPGGSEVEGGQEAEAEFVSCAEGELKRVHAFLTAREAGLLGQWEEAALAAHSAEASYVPARTTRGGAFTRSHWWQQPTMQAQRRTLVATLGSLFVSLHDLSSYAELNETGFRKILKKHDKVTGGALKGALLPVVQARLGAKRARLDQALEEVTSLYATLAFDGDADVAAAHLREGLREQVVFERSAVWKDRMEEERRVATAHVVGPKAAAAKPWLLSGKAIAGLAALALAGAVLGSGAFGADDAGATKRACLAILLASAVLWCTEAVPLYVTSMALIFAVVTLRAMLDGDGARLSAPDAMKRVFSKIFSQTVMLLLGGFTMAAALSKHLIAKRLAIGVMAQVGRRPASVLLAAMGIALFSSMWISNVAAPVLCFSIVAPILRTLPTDDPLGAAMVIGIAMASNIGGMTSPIASPQNIFAIERMSMDGHPPSWLAWFAVSMPVSITCLLLVWRLLLIIYPIDRDQEVRPLRQLDDPFTLHHAFVIAVCLATMGLWCANTWLLHLLGGMGVTALIPMVAFFGFGTLGKDDFESFPWSVVMLAMGGIILGDAATESGLLAAMTEQIVGVVGSLTVCEVLVIFTGVIAVVTSFISHTVGAMVILPVVQSIGAELAKSTGVDHSKLLVMGGALMCSGGMALPVSGFPNMSASSIQDPTGRNYVHVGDFLKTGIPSTAITWLCVIAIGYPIMSAINL